MTGTNLLPSWEHPGLDNSSVKEQESRFGNGSSHQTDKSPMGKKLRDMKACPSTRLKDPPLSSIYATPRSKGHKRGSSSGTASSLLSAFDPRLLETPKKNPPDPSFRPDASLFHRSNTDGDLARRPQRLSAGSYTGDALDFKMPGLKPAPNKVLKKVMGEESSAGRDSTTCEETRSISDNSSSNLSPADRSVVSSKEGEGGDESSIAPSQGILDESVVSRLKDPPIPRSVHSRNPPIPRSVHSRSSSRHSRQREDSLPPPLTPYQEDYHRSQPPPRRHQGGRRHSNEDEFYGQLQQGYGRPVIMDDNSRVHGRGETGRGDRHHPQDRYHGNRDSDRYDGGRPPPPRPHVPFEDDNVSRLSRSSRYTHDHYRVCDDASRRSELDHGGSRHSKGSRQSKTDLSVSHASRFEMDRATGYHHKQRDRYSYDDDRSRYSHRSHQPSRGYHDDYRPHYSHRDDRSHYGRDDRSRYPDDRSRYHDRDDRSRYHPDDRSHSHYHEDDRPRHPDDRSRSGYHNERSHYHPHDRDSSSRYHDRDDRSRYPHDRDDRSRYDDRSRCQGSRYHDGDDNSTIVTNFTTRSRKSYTSLGRGDEQSLRGGQSHHSLASHSRSVRDHGHVHRHDSRRPLRREELGIPRASLRDDDSAIQEARFRSLGLRVDTLKEVGGGKPPAGGDIYVDIGFGEKAKLRRTKETVDAVARDYYAPAKCFACTTDLFCIADVQYIVCPECKTISPADQAASGGTATNLVGASPPLKRHGVGLGFTYDTLSRMQAEVMEKRGSGRAAKAGGY